MIKEKLLDAIDWHKDYVEDFQEAVGRGPYQSKEENQ